MMLSRHIDAALASVYTCRQRVPFLRDRYPEGSPERKALDELIGAANRADAILMAPNAVAPAPAE